MIDKITVNLKDNIFKTAITLKGLLPGNNHINNLKIRSFQRSGKQVFFGYYDVTPFSHDNKLLLAMHAPLENSTPKPESEVTLGYYDFSQESSSFIKIGRTTTWCWQQGCRLQWYPQNNSNKVLYNRLVDGKYSCVVQDIKTREINTEYKRPVYAVSSDGRWGLSLDFSRLQRLRPGYGYVNFPDETKGQMAPDKNGIWRIDMKTRKESLLFSIAEIVSFESLDSMKDAEHYFNHILFNPDGSRFMFIHLWVKSKKRFGRLITCDVEGKDKYALINEGHTSHYIWQSDDELLVYSTHTDSGTHYHLYKDKSDIRKIIGKDILDQDGHPSFSPDRSLLLTDTYPSRLKEQQLLIYEVNSNKLTCLSSFFSPYKFSGEVRCDLHPRWSPSGKYICIDSAHEGKRAMYVIDMSQHLN